MKYEIINPHDKCFISGEEKIVKAAVLFLGNGLYGLDDENDKSILGMAFDNQLDLFEKEIGMSAEDFLCSKSMKVKLIEALKTVSCESETSLVHLVGIAKSLAESLEAGLIDDSKETA